MKDIRKDKTEMEDITDKDFKDTKYQVKKSRNKDQVEIKGNKMH